MKQIYHDGPIEIYEVRDISAGEICSFSGFEAADLKFEEWKRARIENQIEFVAVIAS